MHWHAGYGTFLHQLQRPGKPRPRIRAPGDSRVVGQRAQRLSSLASYLPHSTSTCGSVANPVRKPLAVEINTASSPHSARRRTLFPPIHAGYPAHSTYPPVEAAGEPDRAPGLIHYFSSTPTFVAAGFRKSAPARSSMPAQFRRAFPLPHSQRLRRLSIQPVEILRSSSRSVGTGARGVRRGSFGHLQD
jgi:hypothetical protein